MSQFSNDYAGLKATAVIFSIFALVGVLMVAFYNTLVALVLGDEGWQPAEYTWTNAYGGFVSAVFLVVPAIFPYAYHLDHAWLGLLVSAFFGLINLAILREG